MNDVPPNQPPSDDIDSFYRRASALDPSRPSDRTRQAVLAHARKVAASDTRINTKLRWREVWWRPAVFGTLAAAGLAGLLALPQILTPRVAPRTTDATAQLSEPAAGSAATGAQTTQGARPSADKPTMSPLAAPARTTAAPAPMAAPQEPTAVPPAPAATAPAPAAAPPAPAAAPPAPAAAPPAPAAAAPALAAPPTAEALPAAPAPPPPAAAKRSAAPSLARADEYVAPTRERDSADRPEAKANAAARADARVAASMAGPGEAKGREQPTPELESITVAGQRKAPRDVSAASPMASVAPSEPARAAESAGASEAFRAQAGPPQALRLAAETGDLKQLQRLLDQLTDVNSRDDAGRTALLLATLHGQTKAIEMLLAHGADPNVADGSGVTPLSAATAANRSAIVRMLKNAGAR